MNRASCDASQTNPTPEFVTDQWHWVLWWFNVSKLFISSFFLIHVTRENTTVLSLMKQITISLGRALGYFTFFLRHILKKEALYKYLASNNLPLWRWGSISLGSFQGVHACESAALSSEVKLSHVSFLTMHLLEVLFITIWWERLNDVRLNSISCT